MLPRLYYSADIVNSLSTYFYFIQGAFVAACIWILRNREFGRERVLVAAFVVAHAFATFLLGWAGASLNHLTEAMVATAMIAARGAARGGADCPRLAISARRLHPPADPAVLSDVDPGAAPANPFRPLALRQGNPRIGSGIRLRVEVHQRPTGPALCETLLLCYAAGKPEESDSFAVDEALRTGTIPMSEILQLLETRHFRAIQIEVPASQPMQPTPRIRFPGPFMRTLFAKYKLAFRTKWYAVFVPNEGP
jgi:hypothetical protein